MVACPSFPHRGAGAPPCAPRPKGLRSPPRREGAWGPAKERRAADRQERRGRGEDGPRGPPYYNAPSRGLGSPTWPRRPPS
eukprot:7448249-Pyramimonas_sp.AAC.1